MADFDGDIRGLFDIWLKRIENNKYVVMAGLYESPQLSAFGEGLYAQITPQAAWRFDYGVNTRFISTTGTMSGGYISGSFSQADLYTSTNVSGTAQITTIRPLRYLPGFGGLARFTSVFNTGTTNSEQLIGVADVTISDGFAFGYNGSSFGIVSIKSGVRTWVSSANWNGSPLSYTLNPQAGNVYQIRFQWLGYGNIYFMIFDKLQRKFVVVHVIEYPNTSVTPSILNPTLKLFARIANLGNNTSIRLSTPSALAALEGQSDYAFYSPLNVPNSFDASATLADANNNHLATIRNKQTFLSATNRVPVQLTSLTFSRAGGASTSVTSVVRLYRNATTAGVRTFADVDTLNSPMETSASATTITSTNPERAYTISQSSPPLTINFKPGEFILNPGESLSVGCQDSGVQSTEVSVTVNWEELF